MNTNGYPFTLFGASMLTIITAMFLVGFWPLLSYVGYLTGTGWIGGVFAGVSIVVVAFFSVAREYAEHRELLPDRPR